MSVETLRAAAKVLRDPIRCNTSPHDLPLADLLDTAGADLWAYGPLCCDDGCYECDDELWSPHVRRALVVARVILGHAS